MSENLYKSLRSTSLRGRLVLFQLGLGCLIHGQSGGGAAAVDPLQRAVEGVRKMSMATLESHTLVIHQRFDKATSQAMESSVP